MGGSTTDAGSTPTFLGSLGNEEIGLTRVEVMILGAIIGGVFWSGCGVDAMAGGDILGGVFAVTTAAVGTIFPGVSWWGTKAGGDVFSGAFRVGATAGAGALGTVVSVIFPWRGGFP